MERKIVKKRNAGGGKNYREILSPDLIANGF